MPQSDYWAVPYVVETAVAIDPARVLDIGVGMGQFGVHLRQALDIARGRLAKQDWTLILDGVEIYEPYRNPLWNYYYNAVTIADARTFLQESPHKYDLILICDVIEHFDKDDALSLLKLARSKSRWVLVTTPTGDYPQGAMFGNEAETHRSAWRPADFQKLGGFTHEIRDTFLALLPGDGETKAVLRDGNLPTLFTHTAGSWWRCTRTWFPRMVKKRLGFK